MFTPDPYEDDGYDDNDPKREGAAERVREAADVARIQIRHRIGWPE